MDNLDLCLAMLWHGTEGVNLQNVSAASALALGGVLGLRHATEADHVIAVSTIVSEQRNVWRAATIGGVWGIGHTLSLIAVGAFVLLMRVAVPESLSTLLEFGVALMIIGLGINAVIKATGNRQSLTAGNRHSHHHDSTSSATNHRRFSLKPLLVGAMHGLAGSGALTLLVLTQINSVALGLFYLLVFGIGSVGGMLLMSGLIGLPFAFASRTIARYTFALQIFAGALSILFGLWYAYRIVA